MIELRHGHRGRGAVSPARITIVAEGLPNRARIFRRYADAASSDVSIASIVPVDSPMTRR